MYPYPRRGQQLLVFGFDGGSNSLKVGCQFSSGMAHIAPSWVKDWAYAAGKAAIVKVFDYLQAQQPEWHVVQLHPGVVGQGPRKYHPMMILPSVESLLMGMSYS